MRKTKIEWCDYTWNPVTGCRHGCSYCYANRIANRFKEKDKGKIEIYKSFSKSNVEGINEITENGIPAFAFGFEPTLWETRLYEPHKIKKPSKIFVSSMGDLFGDWVPDRWIEKVMKTVKECPRHTFIFLTKNSKRLAEVDFPDNAWAGVSFTGYGVEGVPNGCNAKVKFVSMEPLLIEPECYPDVDWYIIGAQTGPGAKKLEASLIKNTIDFIKEMKKPIFLKDNLGWEEKIQEYPNIKG